jgi:ribosomal protein L37AE/L43A
MTWNIDEALDRIGDCDELLGVDLETHQEWARGALAAYHASLCPECGKPEVKRKGLEAQLVCQACGFEAGEGGVQL